MGKRPDPAALRIRTAAESVAARRELTVIGAFPQDNRTTVAFGNGAAHAREYASVVVVAVPSQIGAAAAEYLCSQLERVR